MYHCTIVPFEKQKIMLPRGIRNNNPLNIRRTGKDQWKGLVQPAVVGDLKSPTSEAGDFKSPPTWDRAFCQFESMEWGWRAAFYLLTRTYYHKYRLYTIRGIISKWAPPQDHNNTEAYIKNVSKLTGIGPDEPIGIPSEKPARWMMVGMAMAIQENGLIKREQIELARSAEREDGRAKLNVTESLDWFAMLRGWELLKE